MLLKDHPLGAVVESLPGLFDPRTWLPTILAAGGMLRRQDVGALVRSAVDAIGAGARQEAVSWIALAAHVSALEWRSKENVAHVRDIETRH
jgi:hypothetical protein